MLTGGGGLLGADGERVWVLVAFLRDSPIMVVMIVFSRNSYTYGRDCCIYDLTCICSVCRYRPPERWSGEDFAIFFHWNQVDIDYRRMVLNCFTILANVRAFHTALVELDTMWNFWVAC